MHSAKSSQGLQTRPQTFAGITWGQVTALGCHSREIESEHDTKSFFLAIVKFYLATINKMS